MAYRFKLISAAVGVTLFLVIAIALLCSSFTDVEFHEVSGPTMHMRIANVYSLLTMSGQYFLLKLNTVNLVRTF